MSSHRLRPRPRTPWTPAGCGPAWPRGGDRRHLPRAWPRRSPPRCAPPPGADWVLLDLEHGGGGEEQVGDVVPAAAPTASRPWSGSSPTARIRLGRLLDLGAAGVMFPAHRARPPRSREARPAPALPAARRPRRRHLQPGLPLRARPGRAGPRRRRGRSASSRSSRQRPSRQVDDIAALDGVDVLFVGPRDLSHDLGVPGDLTAPAYLEALETGPGGRRPPRQGLRPARRRRRRRPPPPRAGLALRRRSAPTRPCSRPPSAPPWPPPAPTTSRGGDR